MPKNNQQMIDDGYAPELLEGSVFDGELEIPIVRDTPDLVPPRRLRPFSKRGATQMTDEFICFYEHDFRFKAVLERTSACLEEILRKFRGIASPDCSLYRDMPLVLQVMNTYLNRAVGRFFQKNGMTAIPNVRWGDRRSYFGTDRIEPFAFLGVEKGSVVSIGTYGCIASAEDRLFFREGLVAMLDAITPRMVLVYGRMPSDIFSDEVLDRTQFVRYDDWTTLKRKGGV